MKHHSQRSKRPPSRTLAPRILAALTAGAVTLGALPYAYADPIVASSVTSDMVTEDGVAGSIDGSSATITVGRTGDGDTPRLQRATPRNGASPTGHTSSRPYRLRTSTSQTERR